MRRIGLAAVLIALSLCGASAQQGTVNVFAAASYAGGSHLVAGGCNPQSLDIPHIAGVVA
jgi:hypothetical protein